METIVVIERTKTYKVPIKNEGVPSREDIPVIETHSVKLLFGGEKLKKKDTHFSLNGIHPENVERLT